MLRFSDSSLLSNISRPGAVEITGIHHLVLEAHQRTVELSLQADAEERVIAVVFEGLARGRRNVRGDVQIFGKGGLTLPDENASAAIQAESFRDPPRADDRGFEATNVGVLLDVTGREGAVAVEVRVEFATVACSPLRLPATCSGPSHRRSCSSAGSRRRCRSTRCSRRQTGTLHCPIVAPRRQPRNSFSAKAGEANAPASAITPRTIALRMSTFLPVDICKA